MWSRIYIGVFGLSVAVVAFFCFYSWSWLQSIGNPAVAFDAASYHASMGAAALWLTAVSLLFLGNAVLWVSGRLWPLWLTFVYFSIFAIAIYFWLFPALNRFCVSVGLCLSDTSLGPIWAALAIIVCGIIIFLDQLLVIRLRAKTYPESLPTVKPMSSDVH